MEPLLEFLHTGKTKRGVWDAADLILCPVSDTQHQGTCGKMS